MLYDWNFSRIRVIETSHILRRQEAWVLLMVSGAALGAATESLLPPLTDGLQVLLMNTVTTRVLHMVWSRPASNAELFDARNAHLLT